MKRRSARAGEVSDLVTARLSLYLRCLDQLDRDGVLTVSSAHLAEQFRLGAAQIRKDLVTFGEFGVRGVGYSVRDLRNRLLAILGLDRNLKLVILGSGNLGSALADYPAFRHGGFRIVALFDTAPQKIGTVTRGGIPVLPADRLAEVARREGVEIAVVAVPAGAAQEVADAAVAAGIPALLNFAPVRLAVPSGVTLRNVDLKIQLEGIAYRLARRRPSEREESP